MKQFRKKSKYMTDEMRNPREKHYVQVDRAPVNFKPKDEATATAMAANKKKNQGRLKGSRIFINAGLIFCSIIAVTLLIFYADKLAVDSKYDKLLEEIERAEQMASTPGQSGSTEPSEPEPSTPETTVPSAPEDPTEEPTEAPVFDPSTILAKYQSLYSKNDEFFGWIRIDNTNVNYPVMYCAYDNEKYLHADFYGNYLYEGIPYADMKCSRESDNILLYGHNMKNGTMFRDIIKYADKSFWETHKTLMFSDLTADYTYEILAVFYDRIYKKSEDVFKFYQFIDAENEEDFNYAISQFKQKSIYDTGVTAEYGDKLVTLITCAYHVDNGRFVVVARRK